jgi:hypothetical protein
MTTLLAILAAITLFSWCGVGVTCLLLRERGPYRVAAIPIIGLCSGILFTLFLSRFGLTGRSIAVLTLSFFFVINCVGWWRRRIAGGELRSALPVALFCLLAVGLTAWPLVWTGYQSYWGFANPDHALYISIIEYLESHPFGIAPPAYLGSFYALGSPQPLEIHYDSSVILGVSYFFPMLSLLTGAPAGLLFGVVTAAVTAIAPASVYVLSQFGLKLPREISLAAASLTACSALLAYTLYLHSLGTMTVIAILPAGIAFALDFLRDPLSQKLPAVVLIVVAMYYDYFPGFAFLVVAIGTAALITLLSNKSRIRSVFLLAVSTVAVLFAVSTSHAVIILRRLIFEGTTDRLVTREELHTTFALALTERGLPFFWGLWLPYMPGNAFFGNQDAGHYIYLFTSLLFFVLLSLAALRPLSGISLEYTGAVAAILAVLILYVVVGNGYGGFKLITWMHPLVLTALVAAAFGTRRILRQRHYNVLSYLPLCLLAWYAGWNTMHAFELGRHSLGDRPGLNNAPRLRLNDFRDLQQVADKWGSKGVVVALPDAVAQSWLIPFFRNSVTQFFPQISLSVENSSPWLIRERPVGNYLLHWTDDSQELFGLAASAAVWQNERFALTPLEACRDVLTFGRGWYRKESASENPLSWQHRFRWLRNRGELLILNPSPGTKRLLLNLVAGYGFTSPQRHVEVILNGQKLEDIQFAAQTRLVTRPFVAPGPWSQIEIHVREEVPPLPRRHALWNRWVPADSRSLNIAVSELALIGDGEEDSFMTSSMEFGPGKRTRGFADGIYEDGWVGEWAEICLRVPPVATTLEIAGTVPGISALTFPYKLPISLDGYPLDPIEIRHPGSFQLTIPLPNLQLDAGKAVHIKLGPLSTFGGPTQAFAGDSRSLSVFLMRVALAAYPQLDTQSHFQNRRQEKK